MVLPLLFVPLVYGISSTPDACALPPSQGWKDSKDCSTGEYDYPGVGSWINCCWSEYDPSAGKYVKKCQTCDRDPNTGKYDDCGAVHTPIPLPNNLPQAEQVPTTPPPMFGFGQNVPQDLQTLEQTPPRFGQNVPQDLQTLQETPPSPPSPLPSPPPPAGPTILPEYGEVLEQPDVEEQDEPPPPEPEQPPGNEGSEDNN
jgi:hypothetical protein